MIIGEILSGFARRTGGRVCGGLAGRFGNSGGCSGIVKGKLKPVLTGEMFLGRGI